MLGKLSLFVNLNLFRLYNISQTMWLNTHVSLQIFLLLPEREGI